MKVGYGMIGNLDDSKVELGVYCYVFFFIMILKEDDELIESWMYVGKIVVVMVIDGVYVGVFVLFDIL